jgi:hypothetical protein
MDLAAESQLDVAGAQVRALGDAQHAGTTVLRDAPLHHRVERALDALLAHLHAEAPVEMVLAVPLQGERDRHRVLVADRAGGGQLQTAALVRERERLQLREALAAAVHAQRGHEQLG